MASGLWFFALLGFFGLNSWITVLLKQHGYSIVNSVGFVTLITTGGIPGFALAAYGLEKIGRKPTTVLFLIMSAVTAYIYGTASDQAVFTHAGMDVSKLSSPAGSCSSSCSACGTGVRARREQALHPLPVAPERSLVRS